MSTPRSAREAARRLFTPLALIGWVVGVCHATAQTIRVEAKCSSSGPAVVVTNTSSPTPVPAVVQVIFAEYPEADKDCTLREEQLVQIEKLLLPEVRMGTENGVTLGPADLGFDVPEKCHVFLLTARAWVKFDTVIDEASCATEEAVGSLNIVDRDTVMPQIQSDLVFSNKIDLAAIRPPGGPVSCLDGYEYAIQARNHGFMRGYDVTFDSKYICRGSEGYCQDLGYGGVRGDGWNHAEGTVRNLGLDCSAPIFYANGNEPPSLNLPSCCDNPSQTSRALQCTDFVVTRLLDHFGLVEYALLPAYIKETQSFDLRSAACEFSFSCDSFFPNNRSIGGPLSCFEDLDLDGAVDGTQLVPCDNCLSVYNPSQEDSDCDGIGDACENP